jgi:hypothetical protein
MNSIAQWIDCLNGDSRETGKMTPDGQPDPSVFSTEYNREGIRLGTSIGLFVKNETMTPPVVRYREFWGTDKRSLLLSSLDFQGGFDSQYNVVRPSKENRFSFRSTKNEGHYGEWPTVVELAEEEPISGLEENRRGALMAYDKETLEERMTAYFDKQIDWNTFAATGNGLATDAARFSASVTRSKVQKAEEFDASRIRRYTLFPLDNRWCYYSAVRPLWNEPRPELIAQAVDGESFFVVRRYAERPKEGRPALITSGLPDRHLLRSHAVAIPLRLGSAPSAAAGDAQGSMFVRHHDAKSTSANLSKSAREYLSRITKIDPDQDEDLSRSIWLHALAIIYTPLYLSEHADAIRGDWPRVPLPKSLMTIQHSAQLGIAVAQLLDVEKPALGITAGKLRKEMTLLGRIAGPKGLGLSITVGWGHYHEEKKIVMPGRGLEKKRQFTEEEKAAIGEGAAEFGISAESAVVLWGGSTIDIYLELNPWSATRS